MSAAAEDNEPQWMHPVIWVLLFLIAPPVWLFLICCRFAGEIIIALVIICAAFLAFWFFQAATTASQKATWTTATTLETK